MLLLFDNKQKKYKNVIDKIIKKIHTLKAKISIKQEKDVDIFVEKFVELVELHETAKPVIDEICNIFPLENDTFHSTKPRDIIELYNNFLKYCWNNKTDSYSLPESKCLEDVLGIDKPKRLELQKRAIDNKILYKAKNNKTFFSKNFNSIEEVLELEE